MKKALYEDYAKSIDESAEIYNFAENLSSLVRESKHLVVNVYILTNGNFNSDINVVQSLNGVKIFTNVYDLDRLFMLSSKAHLPISINLKEEGFALPYLEANVNSREYASYLAVVPGEFLSRIYERYGSRLLEQNVRAFLQFSGKVNKGIRETIKNEPDMFFAYNNGITCTAKSISLNEKTHLIETIDDLQIVNGGQTVASVFHSTENTNVKDYLDQVYVQMKLSVVKDDEIFSDVVSNISRFANTQNKVNNADFSSNNPKLIELEKISRLTLSPQTSNNLMLTTWFFERVRGQYNTARRKAGVTPKLRKEFERKNPTKQKFTKTDLAKYVNCYRDVTKGKKVVIAPYTVARGSQKNYALFINSNLPYVVDEIYFEDVVSKMILFKECERQYGVGDKALGKMRSVVVPYTIGLFGYLTDYTLDLNKIWINQSISNELSEYLLMMMSKVQDFIISNNASGTNYTEWAKKESSWEKVKYAKWMFNFESIKNDLTDKKTLLARNAKITITEEDIENNKKKTELKRLKSVSTEQWKTMAQLCYDNNLIKLQIADLIRFTISKRALTPERLSNREFKRAIEVLNLSLSNFPDIFKDISTSIKEESKDIKHVDSIDDIPITPELVKQMYLWDLENKVLFAWKRNTMKKVMDGLMPLDKRKQFGFRLNLKELIKAGFSIDE